MNRKILQISPYAFDHVGGVEKHAGILQSLFLEDMYTLSGGLEFPITEPVRHCPVPCFWKKGFFSLFSNVTIHTTRFIISHIRFAPTAWFAFLLAKKRGIPYVHIEHGSNFLIHNNLFIAFVSKIVDFTIGRIIMKHADYVICVSQAGKEWVTQTFGRNKDISVIYRGFEFEKIERKKNIIPRIGFVGRLTGYKNADGLIRALKKLEKQSWILDIVGEGEEKEKLINLTKKLSLEQRIHFLGAKDHNWIMNVFYPSIDIIVNSSFIECLGTTIIEALGMGCNVIATNTGGSPEIPGAFLVSPDEQGLAEGIMYFLKNVDKTHNPHIEDMFYQRFSISSMKKNFSLVFSRF